MNFGYSHRSVFLIGVLASAISISACQQQEPDSSLEDSINAEESVPMSADPAEPNDMPAATDNATLNEVEEDTIATVNTGVTQLTYLCSPELKVEATYKEEDNQVVVDTDMGIVTLTKTNEGTNPEVFEVATAIDGSEGFTQWRVAHESRATGVMRTAGADQSNVNTYECNKAE
ncbi:hypothetical protein [Psychrobacter sp. CAL346-MNA-CIBAN-0220]|uniref:hypothetical protein n=1 Tax=Psychrobacter sp. CAL346-MNA-CIBAN-0220 TaxID=3140457 RepID=UPI00332CBA72